MAATNKPEFTEATVTDEPTEGVVNGEVEVFSSLDNAQRIVESFNRPNAGISSTLPGETFHDRKAMVKALTNSVPLADQQGTVIQLVGWLLQATEIRNRQTDKFEPAVRSVIVDADGNSYHASSVGVVTSLRQFSALGHPSTWPEPLPVQVEKIKAAKGDVLTLTVA